MNHPRPPCARRHAEHQLRRDQRAPCEGPTHLQARQDAGERRRDQDGAARSGCRAARSCAPPSAASSIRPGTRRACSAPPPTAPNAPARTPGCHCPGRTRAAPSGSSAIAGSGLNMLVSVSSRSLPIRVLIAATDSTVASVDADRVAHQQHLHGRPGAVAGSTPLTTLAQNASIVSRKVGNSRSLSRYGRVGLPDHRRARRSAATLRTHPRFHTRSHAGIGRSTASVRR